MVETVAVESLGAARELKTRFGVDPNESNVDVGIGAGAGTGGVIAAGTALSCGPLFFLCAMATVPMGVAVGAVSGGLTAAAVDNSKTPPKEQLLVLNDLFAEIAKRRTIHLEVRDAFRQKIGPDRLADKSVADAVLKLVLADARFARTSSDKYAITLKSIIVGIGPPNDKGHTHGNRFYEHTSPELPLEDWVTDEGKLLNQAFDICVEGLALQMFRDIRFREP